MKRILLLVCALILCAGAQAQRFDLSSHVTTLNTKDRIVGVGGTLAYNFTRRFTLESTLNLFPGDPNNDLGRPNPFNTIWRSGNILQAQFGVRAAILRTRQVDIFLAAKPGLISYSRMRAVLPGIGGIGTQDNNLLADVGRQTYFAPYFGLGSQIYPTPRTFFRFDAGATVIRYRGFSATFNDPSGSIGIGPEFHVRSATTHTFQFNTGFGFRFGGNR